MVTLILTRIVFVLSIPLCLYAVYFGVVALFGLRKKLPAAPQAKPEKRFALVVAARNEAAVIGHLVDSLYGQDYPRELYEVIVAPNNCTGCRARRAHFPSGGRHPQQGRGAHPGGG